MDIGSGLMVLGTAIGGAELIKKILGPTADYLGEQLRDWAKKRMENTANIFKNAEKKLGPKINENGSVAPKVLKGIIEDGGWSEEKLQIEYFGGVLASSRSENARDDRGAYFISLISRLSTYQLRSHYLFYKSLKLQFDGENINLGEVNDRLKLRLFVPFTTFIDAMDFSDKEAESVNDLTAHSIWGLDKEDLIDQFMYGTPEYLNKDFQEKCINEDGIVFQPTVIGAQLFMWAFGYGQMDVNKLFDKQIVFNDDTEIKIGETKKI